MQPLAYPDLMKRNASTADVLPEDVLDRAAKRVALLCAIGVVFFGAALVLLVMQPSPDRQGLGMIPVAAVGVLLSAGGVACLRWGGFPMDQRLSLGLAYYVMMGLLIAVLELPRVSGEGILLNGLSSLTVWQLLFPGLVPLTKRSRWTAAVTISLAVPASSGFAAVLGRSIDWSAVLVSTVPVMVAGVVGVAIGQVVYSLTRKVQEARDVGSYRLVNRLGAGGMGEVWTAEHRLLARPAAVKLIKPELLAPLEGSRPGSERDPRTLFEREAAVIARLRSPHTVELYDYGVRDDGLFYYVMELLDGLDLNNWVARYGPMPVHRALHVLHGMCLSLAEAHAAGVVHRDVKPANVFLTQLGTSPDVVKVLDFGLVLTSDASSPESEDEPPAGSPLTVSPEVIKGQRATAASDIYAVGCVASFLLAGKVPFGGTTPPQLVFAHSNVEPFRVADIAKQDIPAVLDELIDRCLKKDPAGRPASALGLAREIERCPGFGDWTMEMAADWWAAPGR